MRDLVVTENITLDGVIDASQGWFSVVDDPGVDQSDLQEALREQSEAADAVLFGRVTFEEMRGYWPQQTDDTTGVTDYLNRVHKYVVSATLGDPGWEPTTVLAAGELPDALRALKAEPGRDIVCTGSITLVHALIGAGLVDEYRLFLYPVVLGGGRRLFPEGAGVPTLRLVETRPFRSGVVLLRYRPASGQGRGTSRLSRPVAPVAR
jgi:dihydrofolate reductase